jgi:hypothetical protein
LGELKLRRYRLIINGYWLARMLETPQQMFHAVFDGVNEAVTSDE